MANDDERREVAERIRKHDGNAYAYVADMCDEDLADLIDPTCHFIPARDGGYGCDRCYTWFQSMETKPNYCPNCGARITEVD